MAALINSGDQDGLGTALTRASSRCSSSSWLGHRFSACFASRLSCLTKDRQGKQYGLVVPSVRDLPLTEQS